MKWLNYHHLFYFWTVARAGTITAACERLRLAQPTISAQLRTLEKNLGHKLFQQVGRTLELTETGRVVYRYANEIFSLGEELTNTLEGRSSPSLLRLRIGVADVLPKMVVSRVIEPAIAPELNTRVVCFEGKPKELLARLSIHELDLVLADAPIPVDVNLRAYNHPLGETTVSVFGPRAAAQQHRQRFPESLHGAPMLMPTANTSLRRALDYWLGSRGIVPQVVAEFEDSALMKMFAHERAVMFPAPTVIEEDVRRLYGSELVGRLEEVRERFFAVSLERRVKHPAVAAIVSAAAKGLFR
jgi:LysR family transcriptional activator of nhaA